MIKLAKFSVQVKLIWLIISSTRLFQASAIQLHDFSSCSFFWLKPELLSQSLLKPGIRPVKKIVKFATSFRKNVKRQGSKTTYWYLRPAKYREKQYHQLSDRSGYGYSIRPSGDNNRSGKKINGRHFYVGP